RQAEFFFAGSFLLRGLLVVVVSDARGYLVGLFLAIGTKQGPHFVRVPLFDRLLKFAKRRAHRCVVRTLAAAARTATTGQEHKRASDQELVHDMHGESPLR